MSLRFDSGWLAMYFSICSCAFIGAAPQLRGRDYTMFNPSPKGGRLGLQTADATTAAGAPSVAEMWKQTGSSPIFPDEKRKLTFTPPKLDLEVRTQGATRDLTTKPSFTDGRASPLYFLVLSCHDTIVYTASS